MYVVRRSISSRSDPLLPRHPVAPIVLEDDRSEAARTLVGDT